MRFDTREKESAECDDMQVIGYRLFEMDSVKGRPTSLNNFVGRILVPGWNRAKTCHMFGQLAEEPCYPFGNGCGYYAYKQIQDAFRYRVEIFKERLTGADRYVVARVELAGGIVEHEFGYRAQYMRVLVTDHAAASQYFRVPHNFHIQ